MRVTQLEENKLQLNVFKNLFAVPSDFLYIFVKFKVHPCLMLKSNRYIFSLPRC